MLRGKPERRRASFVEQVKNDDASSGQFHAAPDEWRSGQPQALGTADAAGLRRTARLARNYMRAERGSHTLQATAVVHEAFMRLIQANVAIAGSGSFLRAGLAADAPCAGRPREIALADQAQFRRQGSDRRRHRRDAAAASTST
jgi:hypothetical protein